MRYAWSLFLLRRTSLVGAFEMSIRDKGSIFTPLSFDTSFSRGVVLALVLLVVPTIDPLVWIYLSKGSSDVSSNCKFFPPIASPYLWLCLALKDLILFCTYFGIFSAIFKFFSHISFSHYLVPLSQLWNNTLIVRITMHRERSMLPMFLAKLQVVQRLS